MKVRRLQFCGAVFPGARLRLVCPIKGEWLKITKRHRMRHWHGLKRVTPDSLLFPNHHDRSILQDSRSLTVHSIVPTSASTTVINRGCTPSPTSIVDSMVEENGRVGELCWAVSHHKLAAGMQACVNACVANHACCAIVRGQHPAGKVKAKQNFIASGSSRCTLLDHFSERIVPFIPLDQDLQAYFFRTHRTPNISNPREIHIEATRVVNNIRLCDSQETIARRISHWSQRLFSTGIANVESSRTTATLVHSISDELLWEWGLWKEHETFRREFLQVLFDGLITSWSDAGFEILPSKTGSDPRSDMFEFAKTRVLNIAAFAGDLFATGMVPVSDMCRTISILMDGLYSRIHCLSLYVLLLRASSHASEGLPRSFLLKQRHILVWRIKFVENEMTKRWLIAICTVLDMMTLQDWMRAEAVVKGA